MKSACLPRQRARYPRPLPTRQAPPLTPTIRFFVLTEVPMSVCPFCSSDADWPDNIIVVKVDDPVTALPYDSPITVSGTLEIGSETDPETGFVSQLRIHADSISG